MTAVTVTVVETSGMRPLPGIIIASMLRPSIAALPVIALDIDTAIVATRGIDTLTGMCAAMPATTPAIMLVPCRAGAPLSGSTALAFQSTPAGNALYKRIGMMAAAYLSA